MTAPLVSVVIPAYNEEQRLPRTLEAIITFLSARGEPFEIVVVDDGSSDDTVAVSRGMGSAAVRVLSNASNRGKGFSVRRGMLVAQAPLRLMCDADLSTPIEELPRLEEAVVAGADVAIGSRALAASRIEVHQPWYREAMGRVFNRLVRLIAVAGISDTQCGFKLFTAAAAEACFGAARLDGFSFDVEALLVARRRGLCVVEVPVVWRNDAASRVSTYRGILAFLDLIRIRLNCWRGLYDQDLGSGMGL